MFETFSVNTCWHFGFGRLNLPLCVLSWSDWHASLPNSPDSHIPQLQLRKTPHQLTRGHASQWGPAEGPANHYLLLFISLFHLTELKTKEQFEVFVSSDTESLGWCLPSVPLTFTMNLNWTQQNKSFVMFLGFSFPECCRLVHVWTTRNTRKPDSHSCHVWDNHDSLSISISFQSQRVCALYSAGSSCVCTCIHTFWPPSLICVFVYVLNRSSSKGSLCVQMPQIRIGQRITDSVSLYLTRVAQRSTPPSVTTSSIQQVDSCLQDKLLNSLLFFINRTSLGQGVNYASKKQKSWEKSIILSLMCS